MTVQGPILLTEAQAAKRLHTCNRTLRRARKDGRLPFVKIGREICYTPEDLNAFVQSAKTVHVVRPVSKAPLPKRVGKSGTVVPFSEMQRK